VQQDNIHSDKYWEDIFDTIDMDFLPLDYIHLIIVKFTDGKIWEIDVNQSAKETRDVDDVLDEFFQEYEDKIESVDFRIHTEKLKRDVTKRTKKFMKLNR
tara:strand:- start:34885 stop:35184 length:300 start_codon:yes stop_codon:yes gene_type:complete